MIEVNYLCLLKRVIMMGLWLDVWRVSSMRYGLISLLVTFCAVTVLSIMIVLCSMGMSVAMLVFYPAIILGFLQYKESCHRVFHIL